jgi:hypothetical protein
MTATPHNGKEEDFQLFMLSSTEIGSRDASVIVFTLLMSRILCVGWSRSGFSSSMDPALSRTACVHEAVQAI